MPPPGWQRRGGCTWISLRSPPSDVRSRSSGPSTRSTSTTRGAVPSGTPGSDNRVVRVCRLLNHHRAKYLVAGGVAANLHGSVRATRDVDLLIPREVANTERV